MGNLQTVTKKDIGPHWVNQLADVRWSTHPKLLLTLFSILAAILVAPVWTVKYPPLVDFPNHLASAFVLAHMHDPRFQFSRFYAPHWQLSPYVTMDLLLVGLQKFFPVQIAGRIILTLSLIAVPPAVWLFIREANPGESRLAFWSLLVCNNLFFFLYGFINLQLSMALCFLTLGLWLRYLRNPRKALWWAVCALATALYFTHIVGFAVAGILVTCYVFVTRRSISQMILSGLLFLPGIGLYLCWKASDTAAWPMAFPSLMSKLETIPAMVLGYSIPLDFLTLVVVVICIVWAASDNPEFQLNVPWIVAIGALFVVYLVLPNNYGPGTMVAQRVLPFIFVVGLAGARIGRRGIYLVAIALVLFVARAVNVEMNFVSMQPHLYSLARSFSAIPDNARVLPIIRQKGDAGIPEDYFWSYGVIEKGWFSPYLFHDKGVQPLRIKEDTYTLGRYPYFTKVSAPVKWSRVQAEYDYIWAYGASMYSRQMAGIGKLVLDSDGLQVYQLTKPAEDCHPETKSKQTPRQ